MINSAIEKDAVDILEKAKAKLAEIGVAQGFVHLEHINRAVAYIFISNENRNLTQFTVRECQTTQKSLNILQ